MRISADCLAQVSTAGRRCASSSDRTRAPKPRTTRSAGHQVSCSRTAAQCSADGRPLSPLRLTHESRGKRRRTARPFRPRSERPPARARIALPRKAWSALYVAFAGVPHAYLEKRLNRQVYDRRARSPCSVLPRFLGTPTSHDRANTPTITSGLRLGAAQWPRYFSPTLC